MIDNPQTQAVIVKSQWQDRSVPIDLSALLGPNSSVASATPYTLAPTTNPPLVFSVLALNGAIVDVQVTGGLDGTSYGIGLAIIDSNGIHYNFTVAVSVREDIAVKFQDTNPFAFQALMDTIDIGGAAIGKAFFILPAGTDVTSGYVTWSLLDKRGTVYATGNAYDFTISTSSTSVAVEAHAVVNTPSTLEPSESNDTYQLRWELNLNNTVNQYAFENLRVAENFTVGLGAQDTVEMVGDLAYLDIVLDRAWDSVSADVYASVGNTLLAKDIKINQSKRVSSGWYYQAAFDTNSVAASLDPYIISWKYKNQIGTAYRDTGQLFVVNASILRAVKSVEAMISKAKTTLMGFQDELFSVPVIVTMLARGRDTFNGAGGLFTTFNMTNADAMIRELWLKYTEVQLLQAQYLLEGEKAYNFSGQAISLEVDRTQFYQSLANDIKTAADADAKQVKRNLLIKGLTGGDGSLAGAGRYGSTGPIGLSISPATPYGWGNGGLIRR
jgi:hypothetical protein